jgi:multidrug efflux pump subunit AcrA (membrane-fusion protein)
LFGKTDAPVKPAESQSYAARVERLPEVNTLPVRALAEAGGALDLQVDGVVVPFREVQLAAEVAGRIVYKAPECRVGAFVEAGQLLYRIDPTDYQNEIDRLTKLREQEYQAVGELVQEMVNTERSIDLAKQDVEIQEGELRRVQSLEAGFASLADLDRSKKALLQTKNTLQNWENQLDLMRQRRARLEAAEQLVQTQLQLARTNLERSEIKSPIAGVIASEQAELNSFVQRGTVIVSIEDTTKAEVVVNLRTDQLYWVREQSRDLQEADSEALQTDAASYSLPPTKATVEYQVAGRDDEYYRWSGLLERYDGIGFDTTSRTVPVRITVDHPRRIEVFTQNASRTVEAAGPSALVRGMFVRVYLHIQPQRQLLVLPAVALKPGNRIWKLSPGSEGLQDESSETEGDAGADAAGPASDFRLEDWMVGKLDVLDRVRPIELVRSTEVAFHDGELAVDGTGKAAYWICEVSAAALRPADRLIVSPLPTFDSQENYFVRTKVEQTNSTPTE